MEKSQLTTEEKSISKLEYIMQCYGDYVCGRVFSKDDPDYIDARAYIDKFYPEFLDLELVHKSIVK